LEELSLGLGADQSDLRLSVFEQDQRRDAHHVEPPSHLEVVVDVQLPYLDLARLFLGDLFQNRGDHFARATPLGPEIHQHGDVRTFDMLVKGSVAQRHNLLAHVFLLVTDVQRRGG